MDRLPVSYGGTAASSAGSTWSTPSSTPASRRPPESMRWPSSAR